MIIVLSFIVFFPSILGGVDEKTTNSKSSTRQDSDNQVDTSGKKGHNKMPDPPPLTLPMDLAENIKGMYRLLDLISESGSNGCGNMPFPDSLLVSSIKLSVIVVDKVIIAQDSLKRFINTICPESYTSLTNVDFKALDRFTIKPLGIYGSKVEIVRFLRSLNAINEEMCMDFPFIFVRSLIRPLVPRYYSHQLRAVVPGQPYCPACMSW